MMKNDRFIRKHLHGELLEEEVQKFNQLLESDQDFAEEVKLQTLLYAQRSKELKGYLDKSGHTSEKPTTNSKVVLFKIIRNVAAIFVLTFISYYSFNYLNTKDDSSILDSFYDDPYISPGLLQGEEEDQSFWKTAIELYGERQYEKAELEITKITNPTAEQKLYLGLSKMYKTPANVEEAISIFTNIIQDPENLDRDVATWHLSLAYLKNNQKELAKPLLEEISKGNHYKQKDAVSILQAFDKL